MCFGTRKNSFVLCNANRPRLIYLFCRLFIGFFFSIFISNPLCCKKRKMAEVIEGSSSLSLSSTSSTNSGHMNPIIPIISADIQLENPRPQSSSASQSAASVQQQQQQQLNATQEDAMNMSIQEPEAKKRKLEPAVPSTSSGHDKLELRLGGILCCAVCLDLPKTAMYQVGTFVLSRQKDLFFVLFLVAFNIFFFFKFLCQQSKP